MHSETWHDRYEHIRTVTPYAQPTTWRQFCTEANQRADTSTATKNTLVAPKPLVAPGSDAAQARSESRFGRCFQTTQA